ncbi:hypothetical protein GCM10012290_14130 [Halolactibacillus alkaliphilus]|uniref:Uncharacterized protein n=1 Tax=Halolactibacillus alkaliphilus TaxID=442899 RepID=A0A511X1R3_9BACI|nr:hypothetical protein [Halolactibacillus alkaliphilus]GEN56896.1 hypothetical protein HAL01_13600 [Halolactibacillus alkaliphilus]GGN70375.1 hypothetical protein GCM10012290_14130 [Halolactibacillus alkaliphilus]SFO83241.1 hypothetical protein SAMN05720591_1152 [Halolactibacillus alkaliphilus]
MKKASLIPTKATMLPNLRLEITFNNGEKKSLSIYDENMVAGPIANTWIGSKVEINKDGSIQVNDTLFSLEYVLENTTTEI